MSGDLAFNLKDEIKKGQALRFAAHSKICLQNEGRVNVNWFPAKFSKKQHISDLIFGYES